MNQKRKEAIELACREIKKRCSPNLDKIEFVFEERLDDIALSFADGVLTVNCSLIGARCARQRVGHAQMEGFIFWLLERSAVSILKGDPFQTNLDGVQLQSDLKKAIR